VNRKIDGINQAEAFKLSVDVFFADVVVLVVDVGGEFGG
jgi:hypothetical protein